jgi:hypothetical protein
VGSSWTNAIDGRGPPSLTSVPVTVPISKGCQHTGGCRIT